MMWSTLKQFCNHRWHLFSSAALMTAMAFSGLVNAHIPSYQMILSRTADNHGRGLYEITQDVVFPADPEPLTVRETWFIAGEDAMSVSFQGLGPLRGLVSGEVVFDQDRKHWLSEGGAAQSVRLTEDWWMPLFHFRLAKPLRSKLVDLKISPPDSRGDYKPKIEGKGKTQKFVYPEQSFVRLARVGGAVAYAISAVGREEGVAPGPGLWIEQDQFLVRKVRLSTQAEVSASEYSRFPLELWLPRHLQVRWGANTAEIHLSQVKSLGSKSPLIKNVSPAALASRRMTLKLPEQPAIREFYSRFR